MDELTTWMPDRNPANFPFEAVHEAFQRTGKQFVPKKLLVLLDQARRDLDGSPDTPAGRRLHSYLDCLLDKYDGRYDYRTYLVLAMLPLPAPLDAACTPATALCAHDRLTIHLGADLLRFEVAAAAGTTDLLPRRRPDRKTTSKRLRLALRAVKPAARRTGMAAAVNASDLAEAARQLWTVANASMLVDERFAVRLSVLPVATVHDEYLFLRVLQLWEIRFALLAVYLRAVADALRGGDSHAATGQLTSAAASLEEAAPLFSLVATMQADAFREFRTWTEGASAIQSRSYKLVEALCRRPDRGRLDSPAYRSVPDLRDAVLTGIPSISDAYRQACEQGRLAPGSRGQFERAMRRFAAALVHWRQTHYRLAVRMLGDRPGTGYTQGVPYLRQVRRLRVFDAGSTPDLADIVNPSDAASAPGGGRVTP
jgi:tryptophan 2,3-dioxygenase